MTLPTPATRVIEETDSAVEPPYHLILLDDNEHTYQYVIAMLGSVFGYAPEKGFAIACVVDSEGRAILMTGGLDRVKLKQDQVHGYGADPAMPESKGSMSAIIEPAVSPG
ncbi:MAG: ATP-dependent Clp protease adaptor ClpS [Dehalococcoidia bacterium]|nr:ATP-dependent Clp protease adaptor ClpS [Dehalococcoidia bacterium]